MIQRTAQCNVCQCDYRTRPFAVYCAYCGAPLRLSRPIASNSFTHPGGSVTRVDRLAEVMAWVLAGTGVAVLIGAVVSTSGAFLL